MAVFKCKMCGGTLEINNESVATCEYCGTQQTLPKTKDDVISNLFNRANNLRLKCEFDKAAQIYEKIVEKDDSEAEAHWGIVLCKYGIEYVEDPLTLKRIPTCHRTLFEAVTTDADYLATIDYSDSLQQVIYEREAREIDKIQKDILNIVKNEKPFDVFICYKETDENGKRTIDSSIANDIYYQLTQEGFKVFYSAITLEDKLGQEYEPYIFAALNSAKVMLVVGTKPEYFNAVWVRNEWSRFLNFMKTNRNKLLIPCYRDMDAYELPEEFAHLQAQDMGKIGFINDIVRGIKKVIINEPDFNPTTYSNSAKNSNIEPLLKRAFMFIEDGEWTNADEYCEKVLDLDPENAHAYIGKLMIEYKQKKLDDLRQFNQPFDNNKYYIKALRFADVSLKKQLEDMISDIVIKNKETLYNSAQYKKQNARTSEDFLNVSKLFNDPILVGYKDSKELAIECTQKAHEISCEKNYQQGLMYFNAFKGEEAKKYFEKILDYKDSRDLITRCNALIEEREKADIYNKAIHYQEIESSEYIMLAKNLFKRIPGYKDADKQATSCEEKYQQLLEKEKIEAERIRLEQEAEAERIRIEQEAEAERIRLEKEAETIRRRLQNQADDERRRLEHEAKAEKLRLEKEAEIAQAKKRFKQERKQRIKNRLKFIIPICLFFAIEIAITVLFANYFSIIKHLIYNELSSFILINIGLILHTIIGLIFAKISEKKWIIYISTIFSTLIAIICFFSFIGQIDSFIAKVLAFICIGGLESIIIGICCFIASSTDV